MKNILITTIIVLLLSKNVQTAQGQYKLHLISQQGGAACLDGTPPGYYLYPGFGQNKNKYLLIFAGGGFCGKSTLADTLDSCYQRSFTNLGSTSKVENTTSGNGRGILSTIQKQNPLFYDWTKIGVLYCDGSEYIGYRQNPISYKNKQLFFRGSRNVKQLFRHLDQKLDFYNGDAIVISGISAGGIAAFQWSNYLVENTKKAKIYSLPDSGFFITDYESPLIGRKVLREQATPLFNLVYDQEQMPDPIQKCVKQVGFDIVDCMNSGNYAQYLKAPIFMVQSPYDSWSLKYIIGVDCLTNQKDPYSIASCNDKTRQAIEDYRKKAITYYGYIKNNRKDVGIWGPSCVQHGFQDYSASYNGNNYLINNRTLMQAIQNFINNPNNSEWLLDQIPWPYNKGCNGLNNNLQLKLEILSD